MDLKAYCVFGLVILLSKGAYCDTKVDEVVVEINGTNGNSSISPRFLKGAATWLLGKFIGSIASAQGGGHQQPPPMYGQQIPQQPASGDIFGSLLGQQSQQQIPKQPAQQPSGDLFGSLLGQPSQQQIPQQPVQKPSGDFLGSLFGQQLPQHSSQQPSGSTFGNYGQQTHQAEVGLGGSQWEIDPDIQVFRRVGPSAPAQQTYGQQRPQQMSPTTQQILGKLLNRPTQSTGQQGLDFSSLMPLIQTVKTG